MSQGTVRRIRSFVINLGLVVVAGTAALAGGDTNECVGFFEEIVASGGISGAEAIFAADLDGDLDTDLISASSVDDTITWYENDLAQTPPGTAPSFEARVITRSADSASAVYAADLDGDGDMDVLSAARGTGNVEWYVNNGAMPPVFTSRRVSTDVPVATDVIAADLDGVDGIDVLSTSFVDNRVIWHRNNGEVPPTFSSSTVSDRARGASSVAAADLDDDGNMDVISASVLDDKIAWHEAEPDLLGGIDFTEHIISESADGAISVVAAQMDPAPDAGIDVLAASFTDNMIRGFKNDLSNITVPDEEFMPYTVSNTATGVVSIEVADLDDDGLPDVIAALSGNDTVDAEIVWYRNTGPQAPGEVPRFDAAVVISALVPGANDVIVADLDGEDGDDVASVSSIEGFPSTKDKVAWYANTPTGFMENTPIAVASEGADDIDAADMDGDVDVDLVIASDVSGMLTWFENDAGSFSKNTVATDEFGVQALDLADMNSDPSGLVDVVAVNADSGTVDWFENSGDSATPFTKRPIGALPDARAVFLHDLDGDMDPDVVAAGSDAISVYENQGGGAFAPNTLPSEGEGATKVLSVDVDGDGALDVVTASAENDSINWYAGDGSQAPTFPLFTKAENPISASATGVQTLAAGDLDGDGIDDVVAGISVTSQINWYKIEDDDDDPDTPSIFVTRVISNSGGLRDPVDLLVEDVDGDLDLDLVAVEGTARLSWFENLRTEPDEIPPFREHPIVGDRNGATSVALAKLNGDDQVDVAVGLAFEVLWYEEIDEICGQFDVDGDSQIDGTELSWLGRAFGETLTTPGPWWESIDLNGDGVVDGVDLSILTSIGVWGRATDTCIYTCR